MMFNVYIPNRPSLVSKKGMKQSERSTSQEKEGNKEKEILGRTWKTYLKNEMHVRN